VIDLIGVDSLMHGRAYPYSDTWTLHTATSASLTTSARIDQSATDCGGVLMRTLRTARPPTGTGSAVTLSLSEPSIVMYGYKTKSITISMHRLEFVIMNL